MKQIDFISDGDGGSRRVVREVRDQRESVAQRKAELVLRLHELCRTPPDWVRSGSVQTTRRWLARQEKAAAVCKSARSSVNDLEMAIKNMEWRDE